MRGTTGKQNCNTVIRAHPFRAATQCGTTTHAGQSYARQRQSLPRNSGHRWRGFNFYSKVLARTKSKGAPENRGADLFSALEVPARPKFIRE